MKWIVDTADLTVIESFENEADSLSLLPGSDKAAAQIWRHRTADAPISIDQFITPPTKKE